MVESGDGTWSRPKRGLDQVGLDQVLGLMSVRVPGLEVVAKLAAGTAIAAGAA